MKNLIIKNIIFLYLTYNKQIPNWIQIYLLKRTKEYYLSHSDSVGLCYAKSRVFSEMGLYDPNRSIVVVKDKLIPIFNKENAVKYCEGKEDSTYWWDVYENRFPMVKNVSSRVKFLDWCIKELKNK